MTDVIQPYGEAVEIAKRTQSNPFRMFETESLQKERGYLQADLTSIDAQPGGWAFAVESRAFTVFRLRQINEELSRRKQREQSTSTWAHDPAALKAELEEIKRRVELLTYVQSRSIHQLEQKGRTWWGCCPLPGHDDGSPSFHVDPGKQLFHCFGCNRGGDVFEFVRQMHGIAGTGEFWRVVDILRAIAGIEKPKPVSKPMAPNGPGFRLPNGQIGAIQDRRAQSRRILSHS